MAYLEKFIFSKTNLFGKEKYILVAGPTRSPVSGVHTSAAQRLFGPGSVPRIPGGVIRVQIV